MLYEKLIFTLNVIGRLKEINILQRYRELKQNSSHGPSLLAIATEEYLAQFSSQAR